MKKDIKYNTIKYAINNIGDKDNLSEYMLVIYWLIIEFRNSLMTNEDFFRLANEIQIQTVIHFDKRQNSYDDFRNLIAVAVDKYSNKDLGIQ